MHEQLPKFVSHPDPSIYLGSNYLVLDVETTNREFGTALDSSNSLLLACWSIGLTGEKKAVWADEFGQHELLADIAKADFVVCWNNKFEYGWLKRCGLDLRTILGFDGMLAEKTYAGNRKVPLSLEATATRRKLGHKSSVVSSLIKAGVCPSAIPSQMLQDYCAQDVSLTEAVFLDQRRDLEALGLLPVAYCRNLVTPVLADIEFAGMTLDPEKVQETYDVYSEKYASLEKEFSALTGGINPKSGKQMREHVYEKLGFVRPVDHRGNELVTDGGKSKVDKATLASLEAVTDEQKAFKRLAVELAKLKVPVQNLKKMQSICEKNPNDPRTFATFNQTVTATDRLSSTSRNGGFNFQNFDRAFKRLFRAGAPGRVLCEADAPQLEFRVAAFLGNDDTAARHIREGVDIHQRTADVYGCSRQDAKARTFAPLYGATSGDARTVKYRNYFRETYAGIFRTQQGWTYDVARDKSLTTVTGLRFYWPDTVIKDRGYVTNSTQIFNFPIQSLATADIIPLCLCLIWHRIGHLGDACILTNTIHDSVLADVATEALAEYRSIVVECFTVDIIPLLDRLYGIKFDVPLGVGIKAAQYWGEGKEEKYEAFT